jgi:UDP-N-acetyl-D-mannosaminuronic acid dehydrogenase
LDRQSETRTKAAKTSEASDFERVVVVGLGYVGIATVASFLLAGKSVVGIDRNAEHLEELRESGSERSRTWPFPDDPDIEPILAKGIAEKRLSLCLPRDQVSQSSGVAWLVCVETPAVVHEHAVRGALHSEPLYAALDSIPAQDGDLICVESTLPLGTFRDIEGRLRARLGGVRIDVGYAPQRVMPGRLLHNLQTMPRMLAPSDLSRAARFVALYASARKGDDDGLVVVTPELAEFTKLAENAYRATEIALAREFAALASDADVSFAAVRSLINALPDRHLLDVGPGVGGACLLKDTLFLSQGARKEHSLIGTGLSANRNAPSRVAAAVMKILNRLSTNKRRSARGCVVAVLGLAYRDDSQCTAGRPSNEIIAALQASGVLVRVHDPHLAPGKIEDCMQDAHVVLITNGHRQYREQNWEQLVTHMATPVIFDTRSICPEAVDGAVVVGLGRPSQWSAIDALRQAAE